jgi:hypothetical protein
VAQFGRCFSAHLDRSDSAASAVVTGVQRVIDHPAPRIGVVVVPPWTEVRVSEVRE